MSDLIRRTGLHLVGYSTSFATLLGPSIERGGDLSRWIKPGNVLEEMEKLAHVTFLSEEVGEGAAEPLQRLSIQFIPAHLVRFRMCVNADIELKPDPKEFPDDDIKIVAILHNVKLARCKKGKQRKARLGHAMSAEQVQKHKLLSL